MERRIVVLGAGYAGLLAAVRVARATRGKAEVSLVSDRPVFTERIRLHQRASRQGLRTFPIAGLIAGSGARLVLDRAIGIDAGRHEVVTESGRLPYDLLIYALGSQTDRERVAGVGTNAFTLDGGSVGKLSSALPEIAARGGRVLVCGGGLTGIEGATELAESMPPLRVTLVTAGALGESLSAAARDHLRKTFARLGIELVEHAPIDRIEPGMAMVHGTAIPFDACVYAGGFRAIPLAAESGLAVNALGQVHVDPYLRARSHPDIYAVGDAAAIEGAGPVVMACKTAMPMGAHAADNVAARLAGRAERPFTFGDTGLCISLGRKDGIIQLVRGDGTMRETILTGRLAAFIKERICRYTLLSVRMEARGWFHYRWLRPRADLPALVHRDPQRLTP